MYREVESRVDAGANFGVSTEVPGRLIGILCELGPAVCDVYIDHNPVSGGNASVFPTPPNVQYRLTGARTGNVYLPTYFRAVWGRINYNVFFTATAATPRKVIYYYEEDPTA